MGTVQCWTGAETKALRLAMRQTIRGFAEHLGVEPRTVAKWEQRGATITLLPESQGLLDTALRRAPEEVRERFGASAQRRDDSPVCEVVGNETLSLAITTAVARRHLEFSADAAATADSASAGELLAAADESTALLEWLEAENVGALSAENMLAELHRVTSVYLSEPTAPLFRRTESIRTRAVRLLKGHQRPQLTRQLFAAAGWSTTVLAWMSTDLGQPDLADTHLRSAWCCAEFAESDELRSWVRAAQHTVAYWRGYYERAAFFAADGIRYTAPGSSRFFLTSALAVDLAKQGDRSGALDALHDARREADRTEFSADLLAGPFSCSYSRAASGLWSDAHLELEQPTESLAIIAEGVHHARSDGTPNLGSERMSLCQGARACLMLGEYEEAQHLLTSVFQTPIEVRTRPLVDRVSQIGIAAGSASSGGRVTADIASAARDFVS